MEKTQTKRRPVFVGDTALIKIINKEGDPTGTIWLADNRRKTLRPFASEEFFGDLFDNPEQAIASITTVTADDLTDDGLFGDFDVLDAKYGVHQSGEMKPVQFSKHTLNQRYGKPYNENAVNNAVRQLDGMLEMLLDPESANQNQMPDEQTGMGGPGIETDYDGEPGLQMYDGTGGPGGMLKKDQKEMM